MIFSVEGKPDLVDASELKDNEPMNEATRRVEAQHQAELASNTPLAQWAKSFPNDGAEFRLRFSRISSNRTGIKRWKWPAVLTFFSGQGEYFGVRGYC